MPSENAPDLTRHLDLFLGLLPAAVLDAFDTGHRGIYSPWMVVWLMVFQRLNRDAPLSDALAELRFGPTADHLPDCKRTRDGRISVNTGGYSRARSGLPVPAAAAVADHTFEALSVGQAEGFRGRRCFLLDGTTVALGHHAELVDRFPPATNQHGASHWPVLQVVVAHDLVSGFAARPEWAPMYGPEAAGEAEIAGRLLRRLEGPAMVLADRNFGIFALVHAAVAAGHDVTTRLTEARFESMKRSARPIGPGRWELVWRPSAHDRKAHPELPPGAVVVGRLVEVEVEYEGKTIRLLLFTTDVPASPAELAALYRLRWRVETDVASLKQGLRMERLSGRSEEMVAKEILLGAVAYNLVCQVRREAAARAGLEPRRLSFSRVRALVEAFGRRVSSAMSAEERGTWYERLLEASGQCKLPQRKGQRSYPRELIPRRRGFPERKRAQPGEQVDKNTQ